MCAMAYKYREEIVGKRFLSVCSARKLKFSKICEWEWRAGIIRAASHKDIKHPELTILVEFDDTDWKTREWIRVYEDDVFHLFLIENTLVWTLRKESSIAGAVKNLYWPSLSFKLLVDKIGLRDYRLKPVEYLVDKHLGFVDCLSLRPYQDQDGESHPASRDFPEVRKAIKQWTEFQDGQRILVTTPSVLVGYRVEVYRSEGTTQWYTAVIVSYNDSTRELTLTDDTVLEEHNEDPCLVQMKLIGDGVVESILKGENVGITPRRRACSTQQNPPVHYSTRNRTNTSTTTASSATSTVNVNSSNLSASRLTATAIARKSRNRPPITAEDNTSNLSPTAPSVPDKVTSLIHYHQSPHPTSHPHQEVNTRNEKRRKGSEGENINSAGGIQRKSLVASERETKRKVLRQRRVSNKEAEDTDSADEDHFQQPRQRLSEPRVPPTSRTRRDTHQNHLTTNGHSESRGSSDENDSASRTHLSSNESLVGLNGGGEDSKTPPNSDHEIVTTDLSSTTRIDFSPPTPPDTSQGHFPTEDSAINQRTIDNTPHEYLQSPLSRPLSISTSVSSVSVVLTPLSPSVVSAAVNSRLESAKETPPSKPSACASQDQKPNVSEPSNILSVVTTVSKSEPIEKLHDPHLNSSDFSFTAKSVTSENVDVVASSKLVKRDSIKTEKVHFEEDLVTRSQVLKNSNNYIESSAPSDLKREATDTNFCSSSVKKELANKTVVSDTHPSPLKHKVSADASGALKISPSSNHIPKYVSDQDVPPPLTKGSELPPSKVCFPGMSQLDKSERSSAEKSSNSSSGGTSSNQQSSSSSSNIATRHSEYRTSCPRTSESSGASSCSRAKSEGDKKSNPSGNNLILDRHEPVRVYRDHHFLNSGVRHVDCINHGLMHPASISHSAAAAAAVYPRVASLPQHSRAPGAPLPTSHLGPYGLSSHLLPPPHVPAATAASAPPGSHIDPREHAAMQSQAYRQLLTQQHPLLPPNYGNAAMPPHGVGCVDIMWQQKYSPNHWVMAQYEEMRMERDRAMAQERERSRMERDRREEQDRAEREKAEREKVEKERQERERQEKERQQRERDRLEREERERAQREAVQQHFEESLRLAMQKQQQQQQQQKNMGWGYSSMPVGKGQQGMGRSSPTSGLGQGQHGQPMHTGDHDRDKIREKEKERMPGMDVRMRQDHERWINAVQQQQRSEQASGHSHSQSHPQNFSPVEPRPGGGQPKQELYAMSRSSPHAATTVGHPSTKSGITPSPTVSTPSGNNAPSSQHKPETSFSLYGYQPFQHTYITHAQLKAREETKGSMSMQSMVQPGNKQTNPGISHKQDKDIMLYERPPTPGSRGNSSSSQGSNVSSKHQMKMMHPGQERSSPMYQPLVGGGGAFKPYEYSNASTSSPAPPAHQNTASPTMVGRLGSHYHHPQQDQPQNLVKGDLKGSHDQPLPSPQSHLKYDPRDTRQPMSTPPGSVPSSYTPPYTGTKSVSPAGSATYSYSLIQQGLVPNPLYIAATHSGANTTNNSSGSSTMTISSQAPSKPPSQTGSPPVSQQYPRATPGSGITSGTPVCRSSSVPYSVHQGRSSHSFSPVGGQVINTNRISAPQEAHASNRAHLPPQGSTHRSPSPAHVYVPISAPPSGTPPSPLHSRGSNNASPRISTTPNPPIINRVQMHPGASPGPAISPPQCSSTPEGQVLPLNLQGSNNLVKRKTPKDLNGRKRQKTNDEHLLPPQLHPQVHPASSPPVRQMGTPPQLVSNTPTQSISQLGLHSQQRPCTPGSSSNLTTGGQEAVTPPPVAMPDLLGIANSNANSSSSSTAGFIESYRSFVTSAQDQYQSYPGKHAKAQKAASDSPTPAEAVEPPTRPASNASSTASVTQTSGSTQEGNEDNRTTVSPALSVSSAVTSNSNSGGSTNHTKLKKAWLQRHSENEDKKSPSEFGKVESPIKTQCNDTTLLISESKPVPSPTSKAANESTRDGKTSHSSCDGHSTNSTESKSSSKSELQAEDDTTSSASETEQEAKLVKRKTRISRKQGSSAPAISASSSKRQKVSSSAGESTNDETQSKKEKDNKKKPTAIVEKEAVLNSRRRGRKTKGRNVVIEETQKKKSPKPPEKPSIAQLKKTGESFLQDGPCCDVAPRLPKCRECRMTPHQRSKKMPNIFCRFYAYRKLRYGKNGTILGAGFSEPSDATEDDLRLWLPPIDSPPSDIEVETSKFLLTHVGDQFCDLVEQERDAQTMHMSDDETITWKRVVQGVREMCDVCETTLFNIHWVCHKCGFVVCIDCYKARKSGTIKEEDTPATKDKDEYQWLLCTNRQAHEQEKLMLTQIIASTSLWDVGKTLHEVRRKWNIPTYCNCSFKDGDQDSKHSTNGICKLMSAVTKCFSSDKETLQVNGSSDSPRLTRKSSKTNVNGVIKQEDALSGYSSESGGSPLSWLADVALNSSGKLQDERKKKGKSEEEDDDKDDKLSDSRMDATDGYGDSDDEKNENFSTLRELLIRPTGKMGGKNSGSNSNSQKTLTSTLDEVISCVIEQRVRKSDKKCKEKQLLHFTRRHQTLRSGRELLPIRSCMLNESSLLYPDVPHVWLGNGKILLLKDPDHKGNMQMFQEQWKRGQPVIVADVGKKLEASLWNPESFMKDFGDMKNDFLNCQCGTLVQNQPMKKFWEGFDNVSKRMKNEEGESMVLKLKDWPQSEEFSELLPVCYQDLMKALPLLQYTHRDGMFNMASRLPDCFVRPDLGPKMFNAYGFASSSNKGTTNLHLDISDSINVLTYVGIPKDKDEDAIADAIKAIDESGCDSLMKKRAKDKNVKPGAIWHIYNARDADKIRDLLNKVAEEQGAKCDTHHDPIHNQEWYLDDELRNRLYKEYGVEGYTITQCLGDAIFIPAGSPHQVRNLHGCIKVSEDFVSPESVGHSFFLTQEIRNLYDGPAGYEDKLQIKNIIYHAVKDALALLQSHDPEDAKT